MTSAQCHGGGDGDDRRRDSGVPQRWSLDRQGYSLADRLPAGLRAVHMPEDMMKCAAFELTLLGGAYIGGSLREVVTHLHAVSRAALAGSRSTAAVSEGGCGDPSVSDDGGGSSSPRSTLSALGSGPTRQCRRRGGHVGAAPRAAYSDASNLFRPISAPWASLQADRGKES